MSEVQNSGQRDLGETWAAILGELAASNATIFPSIPYCQRQLKTDQLSAGEN
jgi:hypothetical protein